MGANRIGMLKRIAAAPRNWRRSLDQPILSDAALAEQVLTAYERHFGEHLDTHPTWISRDYRLATMEKALASALTAQAARIADALEYIEGVEMQLRQANAHVASLEAGSGKVAEGWVLVPEAAYQAWKRCADTWKVVASERTTHQVLVSSDRFRAAIDAAPAPPAEGEGT